MSVKDADPFEDVGFLCEATFMNLSLVVGVTLLKVRILLDLKDLNAARSDDTAWERVKLRSSIVAGNEKLVQRDVGDGDGERAAEIEKLTTQIRALYQAVKKVNREFRPFA